MFKSTAFLLRRFLVLVAFPKVHLLARYFFTYIYMTYMPFSMVLVSFLQMT